VIGRIHQVSLKDIKRYFLRLLLLNVNGAVSFEHLRTVNNNTFSTFNEPATALNLLENDEELDRSLEEASKLQMPFQLRRMFA
jgi:hypothetical protein